jgi:hypothetical protein
MCAVYVTHPPQVFLDKAEEWATQMEQMMVSREAAVSEPHLFT